jgi:hypothetical protein
MSVARVRWSPRLGLPCPNDRGDRRCGKYGLWRLPVVAALLLTLVSAVYSQGGERPGTIPPPELVGRWQGQGRILNNWTSSQSLPVSLAILPDGTVTGHLGIAAVAGGSFEEFGQKKKPPFVLTVNLEGALLEDGIIRRSFRLSLRPAGGRLTGFGASDGSKMFPGASRESMRRSMRLQVTSISLTKSATRAVPSN